MPKHWEEIRAAREDLTDYVVHFTKHEFSTPPLFMAKERLKAILRAGFITPTFAPLPHRHSRTPRPTIQGTAPAVCLTEQPLSAFIKTPHKRYSNYGIAYHKVALYGAGGRPALYATETELAQLPDSLKYLWVRYEPIWSHQGYPVDFTWEREWRFKGDLRILLGTDWFQDPRGVIIVDRDSDIIEFKQLLWEIVQSGQDWPNWLHRVISLETAKRKIAEGDTRYCRIETWPVDEPPAENTAVASSA